MTLFARTPTTNSTVTVSSIANSLGGISGLSEYQINGGDTDNGFYQVDVPWNVNLNGKLYNNLYISTKSFISFGTASVTASTTSPTTDKILLGNIINTSVFDTYSKNFYYETSGTAGNRTLRMRYEGGFKVPPANIASSSITNILLGRASLQQYSFSGNPAYVELILPWNVNFNTAEGTIQNVVRVYGDSFIEFGKHTIENASMKFSLNGNYLNIGAYTGGFVGVGTGLWSGIEGTFPNRTYRIRYEGYDSAQFGDPVTAWEVIFYENNKNIVEVQTEVVPNYFTLDQNGWYDNFNSNLVVDLTNTSGNYNNRGTRLSQTYTDSSLIWEAILYENNTNRIDIQLGNRTNPGSNNHYYGVYSSDTSLYQFPTISNAGYQINSTYITPTWATVQNVYAKSIAFPLGTIWQRVKNLYVKDSGFWRLVHPNTTGPVYFFCKRSTYEYDTYGNKGGTGIAAFQNDTFIVPEGVTTITVELWGGGGSGGTITGFNTGSRGGGGGYVKATLVVTPGETLIVRVGGGGWQYAANVIQHPIQPLTGGTVTVVSRRSDQLTTNQAINGTIGGSGGGYSAILRGSTPLLVAGGGGGGGSGLQGGTISFGGDGGAGGGNTGQSGADGDGKAITPPYPARGGGGGGQSSGGTGGASGQTNRAICAGLPGENGAYLQGGRGTNSPELQTTNLVTHGTASNPGTNGGAAGGGGSKTGAIVCYDGAGTTQYAANILYAAKACGGGGGGGYYGGGGGGCGFDYIPVDTVGTGGGGGGGGSNYVGGAASVISNSQGNGRVPGNTTSPYYLTSYLYAPSGGVSGVPFNAFAQGGAGYGGNRVAAGPTGDENIRYGSRGENGLIVIYW